MALDACRCFLEVGVAGDREVADFDTGQGDAGWVVGVKEPCHEGLNFGTRDDERVRGRSLAREADGEDDENEHMTIVGASRPRPCALAARHAGETPSYLATVSLPCCTSSPKRCATDAPGARATALSEHCQGAVGALS